MKTRERLVSLFTALALILAASAFAQTPPPNDDFANRLVLTGSPVTFNGSLAGATLQAGEDSTTYYSVPSWATGSVWWTWTAPASGTVVISMANAPSSYNRLAVYTGTTLNALTIIDYGSFIAPAGRYIRFEALAGTSYQIEVVGSDTQAFSAQLTATNPPVFIFQPRDCTVSPYGSAFFSAMASGPPPYPYGFPPKPGTSYQWFFNGVPIPGQTFPSLLIHSVTTNQAGSYSVLASNVGGITQGGSATLSVVDTNSVPRVAILPPTNPNLVSLSFTGEPGRWYRVESSSDLQNWTTAWETAVHICLTNETTLVSVPRLGPNHFVRVALDALTDVCVAQLKQMRWAGNISAIEQRRSPDNSYSLTDLFPYLPLTSIGSLSTCPEGGTYAPGGSYRDDVTCSLQVFGHVNPDAP